MGQVAPLPADIAETMRGRPLTDGAAGPTAAEKRLQHLRWERGVHAGYSAAAERLLAWQLQRSVFTVRATHARVTEDAIVELGFGPPTFPPRFYCRVIDVIEEPGRCGFTYATFPGHPESGRETFLLERDADGGARLTIDAVSRPSNAVLRSVAPLLRLAQRTVTTRFYLTALDG